MSDPILGLRANARQFWLLVLINGFVGAMVGLERELLPLLGTQEFAVASKTVLLSFIASFGAVKAAANYFAGRLGDVWGRKRVLIIGWLFAIPVPLLIIWAPSWRWIVFANVLLGINQGLAWSATIIMKIDLVGPARRGLAMGLNEFAGYLAVAAASFAAGLLAQQFGSHVVPFYLGLVFAASGFALTLLFVDDTTEHARVEASTRTRDQSTSAAVFAATTWRDPAMSSCSQAGLVNNLNDGLAWGLFPLLFAAAALSRTQISLLIAAYPAVWGIAQLFTGAASDRFGRRPLIIIGMTVQAFALFGIGMATSFPYWLAASILLGFGTALVYPTLIAAISDVAHPAHRGSAIGVYRLWRDSGYVLGAIMAGVLADMFGLHAAILSVAVLTALSAAAVALRMPETASIHAIHALEGGNQWNHAPAISVRSSKPRSHRWRG